MGLALAAVATASVTGASAHVPGVGNGLQVTTDAPDLRSATIVDNDLKAINFCYDQVVASATASLFYVQTYDANRYTNPSTAAGSAVIAPNTGSLCIRVDFPDNVDLKQNTIAVDAGATMDAQGNTSTTGSEPLGGSVVKPSPGATTAPDLTGLVADSAGGTTSSANGSLPYSGGTIRFTYDEAIDAALTATNGGGADDLKASNFAFVDQAGTVTNGSAIVSRDATSVRVGFNSPIANAARALSRAGAVRDEPQSGNLAGGTLYTNSGAAALPIAGKQTNSPVIQSTSVAGTRQFNVTYDQDIDTVGPAAFSAVLDDGTTVAASNLEKVAGTTSTVLVTFPVSVGDEPSAVVRLVDGGGSVRQSNAPKLLSTVSSGDSGPGAPANPGVTNAPDLLSISRSGTQVTFNYDEKVSQGKSAAFFTTASGGKQTFAGGSVVENGNSVTVNAGNAATNSVGAGNVFGSVQDAAGHLSPSSGVAYATEQAPPVATTTSTSTITPPPPPPPAKVVRAKYRTSFTSFKVRSKTRYSGRIASSGRGCKSGRRIALKKSGRTIRNGFTKGDGTFSIKRSSGTRGKRGKGVYVVVTERTNATLTCTARGSKKLKKG